MKEQTLQSSQNLNQEREMFLDFLRRQIERINRSQNRTKQTTLNIFTSTQRALF